jgi:hypothetical protein
MEFIVIKDDDTRMLKNIGAKFIGRSIYSWDTPQNFINPTFLDNAEQKIREMHQYDPDIVFQAAIFEIVSTKVTRFLFPLGYLKNMNCRLRNGIFRM